MEGEHKDCYTGSVARVKARRNRGPVDRALVVAFHMDSPVAAHMVVNHRWLEVFPALQTGFRSRAMQQPSDHTAMVQHIEGSILKGQQKR